MLPLAETENVENESVDPPEFVSHRANRQGITRYWPWEVTDRDHNR